MNEREMRIRASNFKWVALVILLVTCYEIYFRQLTIVESSSIFLGSLGIALYFMELSSGNIAAMLINIDFKHLTAGSLRSCSVGRYAIAGTVCLITSGMIHVLHELL